MLNMICHRGPDAHGDVRCPHVWLGHARLSILDLSDAGRQPMASDDGNLILSYNGEIYNYRDLAVELSLTGLRSTSDTEVILRAFEKLGPTAFLKFNGMFAFALFDQRSQRLWLVRDRLGVKPLYYQIEDEKLIFSSEIKAIRALDESSAAICDISTLHEWLYYGNALGGRTLYRGIRQLLPGCYLELDLAAFQWHTRRYWSVSESADPSLWNPQSDREMIATTRSLLETAVARQLISDVPIGIFLSGGVDSSAITAIASRAYGRRLTTYSAGFDDVDGVDERPKARRIANVFGTEHHELFIEGRAMPDLVEKMVQHHDLPFGDAANLPLLMMAAQISSTTKVVLQGDGGDEVFGGYRRYTTIRYRSFLHAVARAFQPTEGAMPNSFFFRRVRRYMHAYAEKDIAATIARLLTPVDPHSLPEAIFAAPFRREVEAADAFARYRECQRLFADHDAAKQMSLIDLTVELPDIFLEKVDRATMAASLEVRVPFLDHELVDYVVKIPSRRLMPFGRKKWLLKKALEGLVPSDVLYGPKTGFNVPFGYWLRTSLRSLFFDHLTTFDRQLPGILDVDAVHRMYCGMEKTELDRANTLWNLLNLMIWRNQFRVSFAAPVSQQWTGSSTAARIA